MLFLAVQKVGLANQISVAVGAGRSRVAKIPYLGAAVEKVMHVSLSNFQALHALCNAGCAVHQQAFYVEYEQSNLHTASKTLGFKGCAH